MGGRMVVEKVVVGVEEWRWWWLDRCEVGEKITLSFLHCEELGV